MFDYKKKVYVILNSMLENNVRVTPEKMFFPSNSLFSANSSDNNQAEFYIDGTTSSNFVFSKLFDHSTSDGIDAICELYKIHKDDPNFIGNYPYQSSVLEVDELGEYVDEIDVDLNYKYGVVEDGGELKPNILPALRTRGLIFPRSSGIRIVEEAPIIEAAEELNFNFDKLSFQSSNSSYMFDAGNYYNFNQSSLHHAKVAVFKTKPNIGFSMSFFHQESVYGLRNRRNILNMTDSKLQGFLLIEPYLLIIYGTAEDIEYIHVYQRRYDLSNMFTINSEDNSTYIANSTSIDDVDEELKNLPFTYLHTFIAETRLQCLGFTFSPLPNGTIYMSFHDKINGADLDNGRDRTKRRLSADKVVNEAIGEYSMEFAHNQNHRRNAHVSIGTSFIINPHYKLKLGNSSVNDKFINTTSNKVKLYWNAEFFYHILACKPICKSNFIFSSNDRLAGILLSNDISKLIVNNENYERTHGDYLFNDYFGNKFYLHSKKISKNYAHQNLSANNPIITSFEYLRNENDYANSTDTLNALPSPIERPIYKIKLHAKFDITAPPTNEWCNIPFVLNKFVFENPGYIIPGTLRQPSKIVISNEDIINFSVSRGSIFDEHASITIKNEDGKYDYIKNMSSYNLMIAVDMTNEYNATNDDTIRFINDISAEELNIPERSVIIFRGVSDFEVPLNYKIVKHPECEGMRYEEITLNVKGMGNLISQMVPLITETFNFYSHIQAIEQILLKAGFGSGYLDTNRNHPDSNVRLQPPIPNFSNGWVIEPPNNFGDFTRKICNEFSGWTLSYNPYDGRFKYFPRINYIPKEKRNLVLFSIDEKDWRENYSQYLIQSFKVISEIDVKITRPVATQILLYGGTVYPTMRTDYIAVNKEAVEDQNYEWYIGKNIPVFVYVNHIRPEILSMILKDLSFRMLLGHKTCNFSYVGALPLRWLSPCYIQNVGYGIVKNGTFNFESSSGFMTGNFEVELSNYQKDGNNFVLWFDEI